jgi:hypothetical protein
MTDRRLLAALGGFAFVAAWIGFGFGDAVLCLLGAAVAWIVAGILEGQIDLGEMQSHLGKEDSAPPAAPASAPRPAGRPRVQ